MIPTSEDGFVIFKKTSHNVCKAFSANVSFCCYMEFTAPWRGFISIYPTLPDFLKGLDQWIWESGHASELPIELVRGPVLPQDLSTFEVEQKICVFQNFLGTPEMEHLLVTGILRLLKGITLLPMRPLLLSPMWGHFSRTKIQMKQTLVRSKGYQLPMFALHVWTFRAWAYWSWS